MSVKKIFLLTSFLFFAGFLFISVKLSFALHKSSIKTKREISILKGKRIVLKSGCIRCHSFVKGKRTDNIATLAGWGNKHFSIKQTEKAIRSCRMDPYCSQILTDKQVKYVAYYLNSLK
jgi:cbb3-type cytochrome oxidase cytochrome c subunit